MRETLFRGKRVDNGEWVYGLLWKKKYDTNKIFISYFPDKDDREEVVVVVPETVGEYTGLKDKNGVKIFEGDILYKDGYWKWFVDFAKGSFIGLPTNPTQRANARGYALDLDKVEGWEVIGNIHDNPELLEVQDEI